MYDHEGCKGVDLAERDLALGIVITAVICAAVLIIVLGFFGLAEAADDERERTAETQALACVNALGTEYEQCLGAFLVRERENGVYLIDLNPTGRFEMRPVHAREYIEANARLVVPTHPEWERTAVRYAEQFTVPLAEQ